MYKNKLLMIYLIILITLPVGFLPVSAEVSIYDKVACKAFALIDTIPPHPNDPSIEIEMLYRYRNCIRNFFTIDELDGFAKLSDDVITKPYGKDGTRVINEDFANKWIKEHKKGD